METVGDGIDTVGVAAIVIGAIYATAVFVRELDASEAYRRYRQSLGRAILLGLEFLVAGDIIRTVAVAPTLPNVTVLGIVVLIRTFLSTALELELEGKWPWQRRSTNQFSTPIAIPSARTD